jgi:3-dehydroquinate synthase
VRTLTVALGERSYPIHIGERILERCTELLPALLSPRAVVVTNPIVADLHLDALRSALAAAQIRLDAIVVPDGEKHKDWETLYSVLTRLLELGAERSTTLLALGGGVIGDLAGFAAASYRRGIPFVQMPTTLLAQVDSSVGGKTGINHPLGKNMIGAFYQPRAVISDTATLATLPEREYLSGIAEIVKCAAVRDLALFEWLEANVERLVAREAAAIEHAVLQSCRIKAEVVASDERESGERALLNFGHTFGHAIETATGYAGWLHGEAVAAGMVLASRLSALVTGLPPAAEHRLVALVRRARLPVDPPGLDLSIWLQAMAHDKKTDRGDLRFVLLESLGRGVVRGGVGNAQLAAVLGARA